MAELVVSVLYDGTLVAVSASVFRQVEANTTPSLSNSATLQVAFGAAALQDLKGRVKTDLVIVPLELEASYTFGLAWEVSVYDYDRDPPFSKAYLIDAHTGKILEEYDHIGGVTLALENVLSAPFPHAKYSVAGGSRSCTGYADENGSCWASLPSTGSYTIPFIMANDRFSLTSSGTLSAYCDTLQSFTVSKAEGTATLDFGWGWGNKGEDSATDVALNGLYYARRMHDYFDPSDETNVLEDTGLATEVVGHNSNLPIPLYIARDAGAALPIRYPSWRLVMPEVPSLREPVLLLIIPHGN